MLVRSKISVPIVQFTMQKYNEKDEKIEDKKIATEATEVNNKLGFHFQRRKNYLWAAWQGRGRRRKRWNKASNTICLEYSRR